MYSVKMIQVLLAIRNGETGMFINQRTRANYGDNRSHTRCSEAIKKDP